ncbi:MAG: hypothetical protein LUC98_08655 [Lachnospiraceae bacterium]|nr:hypothetical protein [Lachnospiraceae bacterium]
MSVVCCGVCCDAEIYEKYRGKTFVIGSRELGLAEIEDIVTGRSSAEYQRKDRDIYDAARAVYDRIAGEIKNYYAARDGRKDFTAMKHSNFKDYVADIRMVYNSAAEQIAAATATRDVAVETWKDTQQRSKDEATLARGKSRYLDAMNDYRVKVEEIKTATKEAVKELSGAYDEHLAAFYEVTPDMVDANTVTILKAGICDAGDLAALAERFHGNVTMLRMIGKAAATADGAGDLAARIKAAGHGRRERELFDEALEVAERVISSDEKWAAINLKRLEKRIAEISENFERLVARP